MSDTIHKQTIDQAVDGRPVHTEHTREIHSGAAAEVHAPHTEQAREILTSLDPHAHVDKTREVLSPDTVSHDDHTKGDHSTAEKIKSAVGLGDKDSKHT